MKTIVGNIIELALDREFDIIIHGCNTHSVMGSGLAPQMARAFGCDKFPMELQGPDVNKLGCIDGKNFTVSELGEAFRINNSKLDIIRMREEYNILTVYNFYTQFYAGRAVAPYNIPFDYDSYRVCLRKLVQAHRVEGELTLGIPAIGCGLAGGDILTMKTINEVELEGSNITPIFVKYDKN